MRPVRVSYSHRGNIRLDIYELVKAVQRQRSLYSGEYEDQFGTRFAEHLQSTGHMVDMLVYMALYL